MTLGRSRRRHSSSACATVAALSSARSGVHSKATNPSVPPLASKAGRRRSAAARTSSSASSKKSSWGPRTPAETRSRSWLSYAFEPVIARAKMVGFEVAPVTASSEMLRANAPLSSSSRASVSSQIDTPASCSCPRRSRTLIRVSLLLMLSSGRAPHAATRQARFSVRGCTACTRSRPPWSPHARALVVDGHDDGDACAHVVRRHFEGAARPDRVLIEGERDLLAHEAPPSRDSAFSVAARSSRYPSSCAERSERLSRRLPARLIIGLTTSTPASPACRPGRPCSAAGPCPEAVGDGHGAAITAHVSSRRWRAVPAARSRAPRRCSE